MIRHSPRRSLFIATAPRSGSWLLAEGLRGLAVAGCPEEYFRADLEQYYRKQWGLPESAPYQAFLERVMVAGTTPNGVFAVKVHWFQLRYLLWQLRSLDRAGQLSDAELLERYFGSVRMVYLERRDVARQAISWLRAIRTDEWWLIAREPRTQPMLPGEFDFEGIKHLFYLLQDYQVWWHQWFRDNEIHPLKLVYEDVVANYRASLLGILRHADLSAPAEIPAPMLRRQADEHNDLWLRAYWHSWTSLFGPATASRQHDLTRVGSFSVQGTPDYAAGGS
jgi:trehalose 2-sulfotransferase